MLLTFNSVGRKKLLFKTFGSKNYFLKPLVQKSNIKKKNKMKKIK
jgi:hypothetical protein